MTRLDRLIFRGSVWALALLAGVAFAQAPAPAPKPAPAAPSPGDQCLANLPQWQTYAGDLKTARDGAEQTIASLKAENARLRARVAELEKPK